MKKQTSLLRSELLKLEDPEERLKVLIEQYSNDVAYIIAGGPSLNNYTMDYLNERLQNELVISIKQS